MKYLKYTLPAILIGLIFLLNVKAATNPVTPQYGGGTATSTKFTTGALIYQNANGYAGEVPIAGSNITITTSTPGQITFSASGTGGSGGLGTTTPFSANFIPVATGTNLTLTNSNIFQSNAGFIGIGTITPLSSLTVVSTANTGNLWVESNANNAGITINSTQTGGRKFELDSAGGSAGAASSFQILDRTANAPRILINSSGDVGIGNNITTNTLTGSSLSVLAAGNVGIGTTTPTNALTVIGDISDSNLTPGNCVQASTAGLLTTISSPCGSGSLSGGVNGQKAFWTSASTLGSSGDAFDNGVVSGVNATSSTVNFNIQGTSTLDPFNVASSSSNSILKVLSTNGVLLSQNASSTNSASTVKSTVPVLQLGSTALTTLSAGGTVIGVNQPAGSTGNLLELETNNTTELRVTGAGVTTINGATTLNSTLTVGGNITYTAGNSLIAGGSGSLSLQGDLSNSTVTGDIVLSTAQNQIFTSGTGEEALILGKYVVSSGTGIYFGLSVNPQINQTSTPNGISGSISINPVALQVYDYRAIWDQAATVTLDNANPISEAYNALFQPLTYTTSSTTKYTIATSSTVDIAGAPVASTTSVALTNSIGLNIEPNVLNASTTNGIGLDVFSPSGAVNNYSAFFNTGGVVLGSTINNTASSTGNLSLFHLIGNSATPTIATSTGVGSTCITGCSASLDSNTTDLSADVSVTTGGTPAGSAAIFTVTFSKAYGVTPHCVFSPDNAATSLLSGVTMTYITETANGYTMNSGSSGLVGSTTYSWEVMCVQ